VAQALVALGSNLGDRIAHLTRAVEELKKLPDTRVAGLSSWHETEPLGGPAQGPFLNGAAKLLTSLSPSDLLIHLQAIEVKLGRPKDHARWAPRSVDLDLLAYDDQVSRAPDLTLPHPGLHERPFVLKPLAEIAPEWIHPVLRRSARELLDTLPCRS
jgi:2-amino-4-hydroxy-6-hydroxymethyldihydropteridine diphosphokinase